MRLSCPLLLLMAVLPCLIASADAQTISSVNTSTAPKDCRVRSAGHRPRFKCGKDEVKIVGGSGRATELAGR